MLTIAIDTAQETGALAVAKDGVVLVEEHFRHKMNLLRRILPSIERMLADTGHEVSHLDGVIVSLGPGSFTGLRIGVTVAKSLAYVLGKPIVGVGTLDALAKSVSPANTDCLCPMIFARADEIYWTLFDSKGKRTRDYAVSTLDDASGELADCGSIYFCGTGAERNRDSIISRFGDRAVIAEPWASYARGAALIALGLERLAVGDVDDAIALTPLYVRKPTPVVRLESGEFERFRQ